MSPELATCHVALDVMSPKPDVIAIIEEVMRMKDLNFIVKRHKELARLAIGLQGCYKVYTRKTEQDKKTSTVLNAFLKRYEQTPFYDVREAKELAKPLDKGGLLAEEFLLDKQHPVKKTFYASRLSQVRVLRKHQSRMYVSRMAADPQWLTNMVTMGYTWTEMFHAFNTESFHGYEDLFRFCQKCATPQEPVRRPIGTAFLRANATTQSTQSYTRTTNTSATTSNSPASPIIPPCHP